jgi:hypothetical protein
VAWRQGDLGERGKALFNILLKRQTPNNPEKAMRYKKVYVK